MIVPGNLLDVLSATWPPAESHEQGGWLLRRGMGGGQRASAAKRLSPTADIDNAISVMRGWNQRPLFQLTEGDDDLDAALASRGFVVTDRSPIYTCPSESLLDDRPETARILRGNMRVALMDEIWAAGGIGPARLAVMDRVTGSKQYLIARIGDHPAGVAFVAVHRNIAMIHAIEVLPEQRRKGVASMLIAAAARFAIEADAPQFTLATTAQNTAANALYLALGMTVTARYHYRAAAE
jgi:ribosomal protein S18 acetylase RimI-like enzyme